MPWSRELDDSLAPKQHRTSDPSYGKVTGWRQVGDDCDDVCGFLDCI